jgi:hypothetical protein
MGAFGVVPVENLLRAVPVLNVMDNRRLTLWVAFGLVLLGGIGLDHLGAMRRGKAWGRGIALWVVAAIGLAAAAAAVGRAEPLLRARALGHYARSAARTPAATPRRSAGGPSTRSGRRWGSCQDTWAGKPPWCWRWPRWRRPSGGVRSHPDRREGPCSS